MSDSNDANLQLKKRARRRLVGAIAFAGLAAVVLPMIMDEEPKQQIQDVQIRIPGQDQPPFNAKVAKPAAPAPEKTPDKTAEASAPAPAAEAPAPVVKAIEAAPAKPVEKKVEATSEKARPAANEPQRAAAILSGKSADAAPAGGQYVILIGAFANPANVKQLQTKIGELGIKVYTEPLDSPEGKKTRVRAGPFASQDAAAKALDKMKRIGVGGVVAVKQ